MGDELAALEPFLGEWHLTAEFVQFEAPPDVKATTTFEWLLDGTYLLQRATIDLDVAPDAQMVIAPDADRPGAYVQHYFDSRGVVRLYRMTFDGRRWELVRTEPDFSPLEFGQRFVATFSDDGDTITGQWEIAHEPGEWELDFRLVYQRARG